MKSPAELLLGRLGFKVAPKIFGCVCFVRDHRPSVGKLDPRAIKCFLLDTPLHKGVTSVGTLSEGNCL
jgi:hypothetical protein